MPLDRWYLIHPIRRAQMIAFILHKRERECYEHENASNKDGKGKNEKGRAAYEALMSNLK